MRIFRKIWDTIDDIWECIAEDDDRITVLEEGNDNLDENLTEAFEEEHSARMVLGSRITELTEEIRHHHNFHINHNQNIKRLQKENAEQGLKIEALKESVVTGHQEILRVINVMDIFNIQISKLEELNEKANRKSAKVKASPKKNK